MDFRPFMDELLHITVWLKGRCNNCNKMLTEKVFDYGPLKYRVLEKKLEETRHPVMPIECKKCGFATLPKTIVYKDQLRNLIIAEDPIEYGNILDVENVQKVEEGHRKRYEIFKKKEKEFWERYTDTALASWREFVNELAEFEIKEAFSKMEIPCEATTITQLRKEVFRKINTIQDKITFWRYANDYFIYHHLLEIGPLAWQVEQDIKDFGKNRMRFIILYFPLDESLEQLRTEWIGRTIKMSRGDNDFLFKRISTLTEELYRLRERITNYVHQIDRLKAENANLQNRLSEVYAELRKERENKNIISRDPVDIRKIHELKSLIDELIEELKEKDREIQKLKPVERIERKSIVLEETEEETFEKSTLDKLKGKTVAIIGGQRQKQASAKEYPCTILTHPGEQLDPDFYDALKQADVIVLLTQFIPHVTMWKAKSYAIQEGKEIHFVKGLNLEKILLEITRE